MDSIPFVGRREELDALTTALAEAREGRARLVLLEGEPGIGKTSLALELVARAERDGVRAGVGRAWEGSGAPAWFVWSEALRGVSRGAASLELPRTMATDEARFFALEQLAAHVRALVASEPLVLVLDDLQWADAASLLALRLVARTMRGSKLLVVATVRAPQDGGAAIDALLADVRREATVLSLSGLDEEELATLARARGVDAREAGAVLHGATAGNPLYAGELLREEEARAALASGEAPLLPRTVGAMLDRHLARLEAADRAIVACAAIGPQPTAIAELAAAANVDLDEVSRVVERAMALGVLARAGQGRARFTHDLLRTAARESLPPSARRALHEAWARALAGAGDDRSLDRAHHLVAADPSGTSGETARALCLLAHARFDAGEPTVGVATAERALTIARRLDDAELLAEAGLALGRRRTMSLADFPLAAVLEEALASLAKKPHDAPGVTALRCRVEARLACALQPDGDPDRALALARGAIARARETGDRELYARVLHAARPAFRILEDLDERLGMDRELLDLAERLGDEVLAVDAHARLLRQAVEAGDVALVELHLAEYERLAEKVGLADHTLGAASARTMRIAMQGDFAEAQRRIGELERTRELWAPRLTTSLPLDPVLMLRLCLASASAQPEPFKRMLEMAAAIPARVPHVRATFLTIFFARAGELDKARVHYDQVASVVASQALSSYIFGIALGEACAVLGDRARAPHFYELLLPFAGRHVIWLPLWYYDGSVDRILGMLAALDGRADVARAHFDHAVAGEESLGATAFAARTRRDRGAFLSHASPATGSSVASRGRRVLSIVQEGDTWLVSFGAESARLKDADGLRYLALLVSRPDVPVAAMELFGARVRGADEPARSGDAGEVLDARAVASYRARARELEEDISDAQKRNDLGAVDAARRELAFLEVELSRAVGLGGRSRRAASDAERVRVNVTMRIRKSINRIRENAPRIADHLARSIRTGTTCAYSPPPDPE